MEFVTKIVVGLLIFAVIQFFTIKNSSLLAAVAANIPVFTLYAYTVSNDPKKAAVYLALFTGVISLSFFILSFLPVKSRIWGILFVAVSVTVLDSLIILILKAR